MCSAFGSGSAISPAGSRPRVWSPRTSTQRPPCHLGPGHLPRLPGTPRADFDGRQTTRHKRREPHRRRLLPLTPSPPSPPAASHGEGRRWLAGLCRCLGTCVSVLACPCSRRETARNAPHTSSLGRHIPCVTPAWVVSNVPRVEEIRVRT